MLAEEPSVWTEAQHNEIQALIDRYYNSGQITDLMQAQMRAEEQIASGRLELAEILLMTVYLMTIGFLRTVQFLDAGEIEHGLELALIAREFVLSDYHFREYRDISAAILMMLGQWLLLDYTLTYERESLELALRVSREAFDLALPTDGDYFLWLAQLSQILLTRYVLLWQEADLQEALVYARQAVQALQADPVWAQRVNNASGEMALLKSAPALAYFVLGYGLSLHYSNTWQRETLNQAIVYMEKAVTLSPPFSPDLPLFLTILSQTLLRRQEIVENLTDIEQGILHVGAFIEKLPVESYSLPQLYHVLGTYLSKRYELSGKITDLSLAVDCCRYALARLPPHSPLYATISSNLGRILLQRAAANESLVRGDAADTNSIREDAEEALARCQNALAAIPQTSQEFPYLALNMVSALDSSYCYHPENQALLEQAIQLLFSARQRLAMNAPLYSDVLMYLTQVCHRLYTASGQREYIDLAREIAEQSLQTTAETNPHRYLYGYYLSISQMLSYSLSNDHRELVHMAQTSEEALKRAPAGSPLRSLIDGFFQESLSMHYERTGSLEDLEQIIAHLQEILNTLDDSSPLYPIVLSAQGQNYLSYSLDTGQIEKFTLALDRYQRALDCAAPASPEQNLYRFHFHRIEILQALNGQDWEKLFQTIGPLREALTHISQANPEWGFITRVFIDTLCLSCEVSQPYARAWSQLPLPAENRPHALIEEAIERGHAWLEAIPPADPSRIYLLSVLVRALRARTLLAEPGEREGDRQSARAYVAEVCKHGLDLSPAIVQGTAETWGAWAMQRKDWTEAAHAYSVAIQAMLLIYQEQMLLTHRRLKMAGAIRLDLLNQNWFNLYEQAAYAQARADLVRDAVTSLELGRARELGEKLARDRADLRGLEQKRPDLYQRYLAQVNNLRRLENTDLMNQEIEFQREAGFTNTPLVNRIRQAREELATTIEKIRRVPGYADFCLEPDYKQVAQAAQPEAPLVYIVVTALGSMALLVPSGGEPEVIMAERLTMEHLELIKLRDGNVVGGYIAGQTATAWMRNSLTSSLPVIGSLLIQRLALRLAALQATGVVLIPIGNSGLIPFHAVSYTWQGREVCLLDQYQVSYAPSARVLVTVRHEAERRRASQAGTPPHLLGVGNPLAEVSEGEWAQARLQHMAQTLQEFIDAQRKRIRLEDESTPELPPALEIAQGSWLLEERERVVREANAYIATHPDALADDGDTPDPTFDRIALASWERALHALRVQSQQPPARLLEQGLSFSLWFQYFAVFDMPEEFGTAFFELSQRIQPALPYARLEMEGIQKLLNARETTIFYGSEATHAAVWDELPAASLLHLSCHAVFLPASPLDSAFLLARQNSLSLRDLLEADEQLLARLQLAVLPACQTAVVDMQMPNEVTGLFAGFLHTGVPAVIGTLWSVEQRSAALLMLRFYDLYLTPSLLSNNQETLHPSAALRQAQLWLREQTYESLEIYAAEQAGRGRLQLAMWLDHYLRAAQRPQEEGQEPLPRNLRLYAHPYYWAAFVYYGA